MLKKLRLFGAAGAPRGQAPEPAERPDVVPSLQVLFECASPSDRVQHGPILLYGRDITCNTPMNSAGLSDPWHWALDQATASEEHVQ